jgi:2'-5' RNA ligase
MWDIHSILGHQKKSTARKELFEGQNKKYVLPELFSDEFEDARDQNEIFGFPLCSAFELVRQPLPSDLVAADFKSHVNQVIEIVGYYVTRKPTSTKKGEAMMFGCFLDQKGFFFDTNHFPEATKKFPFRGKGCYVVKGKVAEEFGFYSINVIEMHKLDYLMYEDDAETIARSRPDPVIQTPVVPASRQYEYLLIIQPPPHVYREIEQLKKLFHRQFDHYQAVVSKPHIALCDFAESEAKEPELVKQIAAVAARHPSFSLVLENFDQLPQHTIYISIVNPDAVIEVVHDLKGQVKLLSKEAKFIMKPHMTIARGLSREKFSRASAEFCERQYRTSFIAASMLLIKKEAGERFAKYETVKEFKLEGKPLTFRKGGSRRMMTRDEQMEKAAAQKN